MDSVLHAIGDYLENIVYDSVKKAMIEVAPRQKADEEEVYISVKEACKLLGIKTTILRPLETAALHPYKKRRWSAYGLPK